MHSFDGGVGGGLQLARECLDLFLTAEQVGSQGVFVGNKTLPVSYWNEFFFFFFF